MVDKEKLITKLKSGIDFLNRINGDFDSCSHEDSTPISGNEAKFIIEELKKNTLVEKLKAVVIEDLKKRGDKPFIASKEGVFSGIQLAEEVDKETDKGLKMINSLVKLTIDLLARGKEKLDDLDGNLS